MAKINHTSLLYYTLYARGSHWKLGNKILWPMGDIYIIYIYRYYNTKYSTVNTAVYTNKIINYQSYRYYKIINKTVVLGIIY